VLDKGDVRNSLMVQECSKADSSRCLVKKDCQEYEKAKPFILTILSANYNKTD